MLPQGQAVNGRGQEQNWTLEARWIGVIDYLQITVLRMHRFAINFSKFSSFFSPKFAFLAKGVTCSRLHPTNTPFDRVWGATTTVYVR